MELMTPVYTNNSNIGQNFVATGDVTFSQILDKFYNGNRDEKTLKFLKKQQRGERMTPQEFLKKFIPAFDQGDIGTLHEIRQNIFEDTMQIVKNGAYTAENGTKVSLTDISAMMKNSMLYRSIEKVNLPELLPGQVSLRLW